VIRGFFKNVYTVVINITVFEVPILRIDITCSIHGTLVKYTLVCGETHNVLCDGVCHIFYVTVFRLLKCVGL
jgi:hypothetical protein